MTTQHRTTSLGRWLAAGVGVAAGSYAAYAATTWLRYGRVAPPSEDESDTLLDAFMPAYDIVERHRVRVAAPAQLTLQAAVEMDMDASPIVRAIFRARELVMGSEPARRQLPQPFLDQMRAIGWGVLAEIPEREIVMGAVTQPWNANVVFRPLPPETFAAFDEPGFVKIVWTLRADPVEGGASIFRTETRAWPTDATARAKFRRYWSLVSPGIITIRWLLLAPVKREAERRAKSAASAPMTPVGV